MSRGLDADPYQLISLPTAAGVFHTFPMDAIYFSRLGSRRDLDFDLSLKCGHVNLTAESGLNKANRDFTNNILTFTDEDRMGIDFDDDIEVAGNAS